ncbi:MAG: fasciclin domain-containing protein [bacterium]
MERRKDAPNDSTTPSDTHAANDRLAQLYSMLNGKKVTISFDRQDLFINDAKVIAKDIQAKNGVIHVIDTVLLPSN